jgi:hypothetical protein
VLGYHDTFTKCLIYHVLVVYDVYADNNNAMFQTTMSDAYTCKVLLPISYSTKKKKKVIHECLTQIETRSRLYGVEQLLPKRCFRSVFRQLEKIHACARAGQPLLICTPITNAKLWLQLREA